MHRDAWEPSPHAIHILAYILGAMTNQNIDIDIGSDDFKQLLGRWGETITQGTKSRMCPIAPIARKRNTAVGYRLARHASCSPQNCSVMEVHEMNAQEKEHLETFAKQFSHLLDRNCPGQRARGANPSLIPEDTVS
jgi:hypothetical protein